MKEQWVTIHDVSYDAAFLAKVLKHAGLKATTAESPYVGSRAIMIKTSKMSDIKKALSILREYEDFAVGMTYRAIRDNIARGLPT